MKPEEHEHDRVILRLEISGLFFEDFELKAGQVSYGFICPECLGEVEINPRIQRFLVKALINNFTKTQKEKLLQSISED